MQYYHEDDSVRSKVVSAVPSVEICGNKLCGCLTVELKETLLDDEQTVLCNYISGQYSDGWGEGFEQREIDVGDGKLYVHFWQDHDFELKRDVPDMTEFNKLLNRPKKPKMQLIGQDGNIFAIMGRASRLLKMPGRAIRPRKCATGSRQVKATPKHSTSFPSMWKPNCRPALRPSVTEVMPDEEIRDHRHRPS